MTDSDKLRILAEWFDVYDQGHLTQTTPSDTHIQDFLRDLANRLEEK